MKLKKKFRLESPSGKVEPYSSFVPNNVNKKGKRRNERNKRRNVMLSRKIYILGLGKT